MSWEMDGRQPSAIFDLFIFEPPQVLDRVAHLNPAGADLDTVNTGVECYLL